MKQELVESLIIRTADEINDKMALKYLHNVPWDDLIDSIISTVFLYTRPKKKKNSPTYFSELVSAIGHNVRNSLKMKKDSNLAAKTGAFILYSFEEAGILEVIKGKGQRGHAAYIVKVIDEELLGKLWASLVATEFTKLPALEPYPAWRTSRHATGIAMIKTQNNALLKTLRPETHPMLFECLNRAQEVGWVINKDILETFKWALKKKAAAFDDIWTQPSPEARRTKLREAEMTFEIADRFKNMTFYHLYYYDFRGRKYPTTAYLHEQGADPARGLLKRADRKRIGKEGFEWLLISIASNWAGDSEKGVKTDKLPLKDRIQWAIDNEDDLLNYADQPRIYTGWMKADKPWQFLAACVELKKIRVWQATLRNGNFEDYSFESNLEVYIDGTNNGCQHLCALTRDDVTAPFVNLVPSKEPGDLYAYVGEGVWRALRKIVSSYNEEKLNKCNRFIDDVIEIKKRLFKLEVGKPKYLETLEELKQLRAECKIIDDVAPVFWLRIKDLKQIRKIVKRNTMTIPYGGTSYGLGQQIIDDSKKHGIELLLYLEHKWGSFLGRQVLESADHSLKRLMQLLRMFEWAGKVAEKNNTYLSWVAPITKFPVVQFYVEGVVKKLWIQYGPPMGERLSTGYFKNTYQIAICHTEQTKQASGKQSQGAAPNIIHSIDAAHLTYTVCEADFPVTTIHDSFGCLLADMPELYVLIRRTFLDIYKKDPLTSICRHIGTNPDLIQKGNLDLNKILESEFCFS